MFKDPDPEAIFIEIFKEFRQSFSFQVPFFQKGTVRNLREFGSLYFKTMAAMPCELNNFATSVPSRS